MKVLQQIIIQQESVNDQFLTITNQFFKTGDFVKKNQDLILIQNIKNQ